MHISTTLLQALQANRTARRALNGVHGADGTLATLKAQLKAIWAQIRSTYNLPANTKFAIELDGSLAGELRVKGTGQPWGNVDMGSAAPAPTGQRFVLVDGDGDDYTLDGFDALKQHLRDHYDIALVTV